MLRSRHQILSMLQSSAATTGVSLLNDGPGHRVRLRYQRGETDRALDGVVLLRSSHWYHYRLNVYGQLDGIEIVVCGAHDSCLAVPVWSVAEAKVYQPGATAVPLEAPATAAASLATACSWRRCSPVNPRPCASRPACRVPPATASRPNCATTPTYVQATA